VSTAAAVTALRSVPRRIGAPALFAAGFVGLAALAIFIQIFRLDVSTDLAPHADMTVAALKTGDWPGNFLFYGLNALFAGFSTDVRLVRVSAAAILTVAVVAKYLLSYRFASAELRRIGVGASPATTAGVIAALMFAFSIPTGTAYIGQLPANVWHNSTTIVLMPLSLGLFALTLAYVRTGVRKWLLWAILVGALGVATKPTFAMALGFALPLFALLQRRDLRSVRDTLGLSIVLALAVGLQYLYIYKAGPGTTESDSSVVLRPLHVWESYTASIPLSLLASLALPLVALAVLRRRLWDYDAFRYASLLTVVAIAMFALLSESGPREFDGNFAWQSYVAVFLLFLVTTVRGLAAWREGGLQLVAKLLLGAAFVAHVAAGAWFLFYMFDRGTII
jgi:hypothetical protein